MVDLTIVFLPIAVRLWTRGYDVYTPSRNIVYHDYSPNPNGLGMDWFKPRMRKIRQISVERIKSFLHIDGVGSKSDLANLGIYGLGKRRSLAQLMDFVGIDSNKMKFDKEVRNVKCC